MSENHDQKSENYTLPQLIFIGLMSAANVGFDMLISPGFIALFNHIISGVLIMVPVNFLFISLVKYIVDDRFGSLTIYMTIFGTIASITPFYGAIPGAYKILVGFSVGLLLDLAFIVQTKYLRPIIGGIFGSIFWWIGTFTVWTAFKFPYVTGFSNLFNSFIDISSIIQVPVEGFNMNMILFATICGLISAVPVIGACFISYGIFNQIKKTAVYDRFKNIN